MATRRTKHKGRPKAYVKTRPHATDKAARKAKKEKKRAKNAARRAARVAEAV